MNNNFAVEDLDPLFEDDPDSTAVSALTPGDAAAVSPQDALIRCLNALGAIDMEYMEKVSGMSAELLANELGGTAMFQDPQIFDSGEEWDIAKGWIPRQAYCNGNVIEKLALARKANLRFKGRFDKNIDVLKLMIPSTPDMADVHFSLGATWIPPKVYAQFIQDLLELPKSPDVTFNSEICSWTVTFPGKRPHNVLNNITYGTTAMPALRIIEQTMNAQTIKVWKADAGRKGRFTARDLDREATLTARDDQQKIIAAFDNWVCEDKKRREEIRECYSQHLCGYCSGHYDGSFLDLPDLAPDVVLYRHQRDAVARILLSDQNVLLAHNVGAGKTYELVCGAHELYRTGLSRKNLIVVPNSVFGATVASHRRLYPADDILAVSPADFSVKDRGRVLERIRSEDHTAVYLAHSSFDLLDVSKQFKLNRLCDKLDSVTAAAAAARDYRAKNALCSEAERLSKKIDNITHTPDTPWLAFEKLGITTLIVDEAHIYKNIALPSRAFNVVGLNRHGSSKCESFKAKCSSVRRLIFATGTPLTNSLADLYVFQSLLQPEQLKFAKLNSFDMWLNAFVQIDTNYEVDVTGALQAVTRFDTFDNLPELMGLFSQVCDYCRTDTEGNDLPLFDGCIDIVVPKTDTQSKYIEELMERAEAIHQGRVQPSEDNMLKITSDGRSCALDPRLVGLTEAPEDADKSKAAYCARNVVKLYNEHPQFCQAIFCDIGTPKASFNLYDVLKDKLTAAGIPAARIAFIHDAVTEKQKETLLRAINEGSVSVVIGSTAKLGTGVNIQQKLMAIHHLSIPWRPADMVQREGRILRRGNTCAEVSIFRYVTTGSFDSYSWQVLENKQRFISSFLSGVSDAREVTDISEAVLSYSEIKAIAIGDPMIRKRVEVSNRIEHTKISLLLRQRQMLELRAVVTAAPARLNELARLRKQALNDYRLYSSNSGPIPETERLAFGEELIYALDENVGRPCESVFDRYRGFSVILPAGMPADWRHIIIRADKSDGYIVDMTGLSPADCSVRIDSLLSGLKDRVRSLEEQAGRVRSDMNAAWNDMNDGNPYHDELSALELQLSNIDDAIKYGLKEV